MLLLSKQNFNTFNTKFQYFQYKILILSLQNVITFNTKFQYFQYKISILSKQNGAETQHNFIAAVKTTWCAFTEIGGS